MKTSIHFQKDKIKQVLLLLQLPIVKTLVLLMIAVPFFLLLYYKSRKEGIFFSGHKEFLRFMVVYLAFLYFFIVKIYHGLDLVCLSVREWVAGQSLGTLLSDLILYLCLCFLYHQKVHMIPLSFCFMVQMILILLWCLVIYQWIMKGKIIKAQKTVIIGQDGEAIRTKIRRYGLARTFQVQHMISAKECLKNPSQLGDFEVVFLCADSMEERDQLLNYCVERNIKIYLIPQIEDILMKQMDPVHLFRQPYVCERGYQTSWIYRLEKRWMDVFCSIMALLVFSPLFLVTALVIKMDGGPVFYRQERLTLNGKHFYILKFRSMKVDAERDGVARLSSGKRDSRITPVGRVIRRYRIDELPQFLNILKGDMSLVGPRPERPVIAAEYEKILPAFRLRLQGKAGLTGYAQVYGNYNSTPQDKLKLDLLYLSNPSIWQDIRIVLMTAKVLFIPESTEGVGEGSVGMD